MQVSVFKGLTKIKLELMSAMSTSKIFTSDVVNDNACCCIWAGVDCFSDVFDQERTVRIDKNKKKDYELCMQHD